ncbi:hypothetical protein KIH74_05930 [Kineosporia sp. J2-2]|uniref:Secreted protein n=1 Tax=Kineosporia corallincola TaxID=2835133 RepID=A0ABS5TBK4_9ACTN|nr:hypothetical protein [Kineosporia corallincola]MBT0768454.1 hypothetical protein [Kineosporia corallincola]
MKKLVAIGSTAMITLGALVGSTTVAQARTKTPIRIKTFCDARKPVAEPKQISFACADDNYGATGITWQHWGRLNAIGKGQVYINLCEPTCVEDGMRTYPAQFVATKVRKGLFTKVVVIYNGKRPHTADTDSVDLS